MKKTEKPYFVGYSKIEKDYYTKTTLRNEFGLKPIDEKEYDAIAKLYLGNKWGEYFLYKPENCIEIKRRKVKQVEMTDENIAQALYLINKSAKVSRDTKQVNFVEQNHSVVASAKTRENKLYAIKDSVLEKLKNERKTNVLGYHKMFGSNYLLSEFEGFTFHQPLRFNEDLSGLEFLGELAHTISSERAIKTTINFSEAQDLLLRYLEIGVDDLDYNNAEARRFARMRANW